ncbi:hypothetical protein ACWX0K_15105 [Nitrobacteraceae bacterium UC4446_H13]
MTKYRIDWKSVSNWAGTDRTECEGDELFDTREEAEAALTALEKDSSYMEEVHAAAIEGQGVEGFLSVEEAD